MMKAFSSMVAVACCFVLDKSVKVQAFAPVSPSHLKPSATTTSLKLRSDQELFDTISLANGYRYGGRDYYPRYSGGGTLSRYPHYYNGYDYGLYNGREAYNSIAGPDWGYSNGWGYNNGYDGGTVQGHSRRTFPTSATDSSTVQLETDGRPLNANVQVWQGPDNTPAKMRLYSEDGYMRPWTAGFANTPRGGYSSSVTVDNEASTAFPLRVMNNPSFGGGGGYGPSPYGGMGGMGMMGSSYTGSSRRHSINIDGGALRTFSFGPNVRALVVEIWSENLPFYADVEVWDGPNNVKQAAQVYSDSGLDRPWSAVMENPRGGTISVRNVGPLEFPMRVCVEPIF